MQGLPINNKILEVYSNEDNNSVDIRGGVPVLEYRESVLCPYITIDMVVVDTGTAIGAKEKTGERGTVGILDTIKFQGTEKFKLKLEDQNGNVIDLSGDNDLRVARTRIGGRSIRESSCTLQVVSKEAFDNCLYENRLKDTYNAKGEVIIGKALDSLGTEKSFFFDTTEKSIYKQGSSLYPFDMCLDIQKISIPEGIDSAGYLFWETSRGFNFRSLDKMFDPAGKTIKKYMETGFADNRISPGFNGKILRSSFVMITDMLSQFEKGAYSSRLELFDILGGDNRYRERTRSTPSEGRGVIAGVNLPILNKEYQDKPTTELRRTNDDGQKVDPAKSLTDTILETSFDTVSTSQQSIQNYRQKFSKTVNIVIDADLSLSAGDLIYCKFPQTAQKTSTSASTEDSGIYMIADLCHYGKPTQAYTGYNLVRNSNEVKN